MALQLEAERLPIEMDDDGVMRVGHTRVTLDTVVAAFKEGATAEEIAQQYPSLNLADVYSVIGYYLRQQSAVEDYLRKRQELADEVRKLNEMALPPSSHIKKLLLARKKR